MANERISRIFVIVRKNLARFLSFYHQYNAYLFNRRYKKGLAPWREISNGLLHWLSNLRREAVALAPYGRIVEIGCGDEALTCRLSKNSREVIGLYISMEAIKRAREYGNKRLTFCVHNLERGPLMGDNSLIICSYVKMCFIIFPSYQ